MLEILKAAVTIGDSDAPLLGKVFWFIMVCAAVLVVAVMMGKL